MLNRVVNIALVAVIVLVSGFAVQMSRGDTNPNPAVTLRIDITNDTWVDQGSPSANHCSNTILEVTKSAASITKRAFVQFPITDIPAGVEIIGAKMGLTYLSSQITEGTGYWNLRLKRVTASWVCTSMNWTNQPAFSTIVESAVVSNDTQTFQQPYFFDVLYAVSQWRLGLWSNFGLAITWDSDTSNPLDEADFRAFSASGGSPFVEIVYQPNTAIVNPFYFCDGGPCELGVFSGSGLAPWLFKVEAQEGSGAFKRVNPESIATNLSTVLRIRVKDFFDNELYNQSRTITSNPTYWDVGIPYRLFKVLNERVDLTAISIRPGSATPIAMDLMPHEIWSVPLKSGISYTINFTLKDRDQNAIATLSLVRTLSAAVSYIVNGTNIQEILTNLDGLTLTVNQFNDLLQPGVFLQGDVPFVPDRGDVPSGELLGAAADLDPFRTVIYEVHRSGTGTSIPVGPFFSAAEPTVTILRDDLFLAGSYTRLYVNDTKNTTSTADDTIVLDTTSARTYIALGGQNITVRVLGSTGVTVDRFSKVKLVQAFSWTQDLQSTQFTYQPSVANSLNVSWSSVFVFISWVPTTTPDPKTVVVTDTQNQIVLDRGVHYDLTDAGVYLMLTSLGAGVTRSFLVTYYELVNDTAILEPSCYPGRLQLGTFAGKGYTLLEFACTNLNANAYAGRIVLVLDTPQLVDRDSVIVLDGDGDQVDPKLLYWNDQRTLVVQRQSVGARSTETFRVYFDFEPDVLTVNWFRANSVLVVALVAAAVIVSASGYRFGKDARTREIAKPTFVAGLAILVIVVLVAFVV